MYIVNYECDVKGRHDCVILDLVAERQRIFMEPNEAYKFYIQCTSATTNLCYHCPEYFRDNDYYDRHMAIINHIKEIRYGEEKETIKWSELRKLGDFERGKCFTRVNSKN